MTMKKLLTSLAAAATLFSSSGCANLYPIVEAQQQNYRTGVLEDILGSIVCLRNKTTFLDEEGKPAEQVLFGTGFVYKRENGWSYVTTNYHVGSRPEKEIVAGPFGLGTETWTKQKENVAIVDSRFDTKGEDDIALEMVRGDKELDTIVFRTKMPLHVAHSYQISPVQERFGEVVYVIGAPLGFEKGVTEGIVFNPQVKLENHHYTMLDVTVQPGHSGSPVFVRDVNNELYLIGQVRICMPSQWGICGGFALATEISELQDVWKIGMDEPVPVPDDFFKEKDDTPIAPEKRKIFKRCDPCN